MDNYESKYNDLINRLRKAKEDDSVNDDRYCCVIDDIVPELKESKDEKIRKVIYGWIYTQPSQFFDSGFSKEEMLAWLEKQGEFKNIDSDDLATLETWEDAIKENKEKWQLSDWFVEATSLLIQKVKRIENNENINIKGSRVMLNACVNALKTVGHSHLSDWLKKQGDQNLPIEKLPFEMKTVSESLGFTTQKECDDYNKMVTDLIMSDDGKGEQKPANKVEPKFKIGDNIEPIDSCLGSPLTIYKICDGFYETNQGTLDFEFENNWRLTEQKSAWSEEDERNMGGIVSDLEYLKDKANAKTLKERFQDKIDWLKSLRPQNRWKPSESQLEALDDFIYAKYPNIEKYEASVKLLYQDLKKLKR